MPKSIDSVPNPPLHSQERLEDLIPVARQIVAQAGSKSMMINWRYAFTFPAFCNTLLKCLENGMQLGDVETKLTEKTKTDSRLMKYMMRLGVKDYAAYAREKLKEATEWEKRTSLAGIQNADKETVMRQRAARCTSEGGRIAWDIFMANPENSAYLLERLIALRREDPDQPAALRELSLELSGGGSGGLVTVAGTFRALHTGKRGGPIDILIAALSKKIQKGG